MDTTLTCPDCGGVIGGGTLQDGQKPCTCDTTAGGAPRPGMPDPVAKPKICCKCGKSVEGKKRFRDSLGYWCEACHYTEKKEQHAGHRPCDGCGRYVEKRKLAEHEGVKLCTRCLKEVRAEARKKHKVIVIKQVHERHEKRNLLILSAIALVLLVVILISWFKSM